MRFMVSLLAALPLFCTAAFADEPQQPPTLVIKPDAFSTLVNPSCSHCRDEAKRRAGELKQDDPVLCWTRGYSDGGAIPMRFFLLHIASSPTAMASSSTIQMQALRGDSLPPTIFVSMAGETASWSCATKMALSIRL